MGGGGALIAAMKAIKYQLLTIQWFVVEDYFSMVWFDCHLYDFQDSIPAFDISEKIEPQVKMGQRTENFIIPL